MNTNESFIQVGGECKDTSLIRPMDNVEIKLDRSGISAGERVLLQVFDGEGEKYVDGSLESAVAVFQASGAAGRHRVNVLSVSGQEMAHELFCLKPETRVVTDSPDFDRFFHWLGSIMQGGKSSFFLQGCPVTCHCTWLRDYIHMMKGFKYWDGEVRSFIQNMLDVQHEDGIFYDFLEYRPNARAGKSQHNIWWSDAQYLHIDEAAEVQYMRIPAEADLEYLMVEAVYTIWQATGDDKWMEHQISKLEKGLNHHLTHSTRWSPEHGLVKRPFTIDTWDSTIDRWSFDGPIEGYPYFCIMHGDNSGMYQACSQLAELYKVVGENTKSSYWTEKAHMFKENMNKVCWNGRFYTHMVPVDKLPPLDEEDVKKEPERLSLSNPYDINRGVCTSDQAASILREYQRRRSETKDTYFAEWFSIYPPYKFYPYKKITKSLQHKPGQYVNGGVMSLVAGELAKAALDYGFEDYGADILKRLVRKLDEDHLIRFIYSPDGGINTSIHGEGGPRKWGIAAIISALVESVIGVRDNTKLFQDVLLQPRWQAFNIREAKATITYPASGAYFSYQYKMDEKNRNINIRWTGTPEIVRFHVLLPENANLRAVDYNNSKVVFSRAGTEEHPYANFSIKARTAAVLLRW